MGASYSVLKERKCSKRSPVNLTLNLPDATLFTLQHDYGTKVTVQSERGYRLSLQSSKPEKLSCKLFTKKKKIPPIIIGNIVDPQIVENIMMDCNVLNKKEPLQVVIDGCKSLDAENGTTDMITRDYLKPPDIVNYVYTKIQDIGSPNIPDVRSPNVPDVISYPKIPDVVGYQTTKIEEHESNIPPQKNTPEVTSKPRMTDIFYHPKKGLPLMLPVSKNTKLLYHPEHGNPLVRNQRTGVYEKYSYPVQDTPQPGKRFVYYPKEGVPVVFYHPYNYQIMLKLADDEFLPVKFYLPLGSQAVDQKRDGAPAVYRVQTGTSIPSDPPPGVCEVHYWEKNAASVVIVPKGSRVSYQPDTGDHFPLDMPTDTPGVVEFPPSVRMLKIPSGMRAKFIYHNQTLQKPYVEFIDRF